MYEKKYKKKSSPVFSSTVEKNEPISFFFFIAFLKITSVDLRDDFFAPYFSHPFSSGVML